MSCWRITSPVVTISAIALAYSQPVAAPRGSGDIQCRVCTSAGGRRLPSQPARQAKCREPAVGRAMAVDDVDALALQRPAQREQAERSGAADG